MKNVDIVPAHLAAMHRARDLMSERRVHDGVPAFVVMLLMGHKEEEIDIERVMRRIDKDRSGGEQRLLHFKQLQPRKQETTFLCPQRSTLKSSRPGTTAKTRRSRRSSPLASRLSPSLSLPLHRSWW